MDLVGLQRNVKKIRNPFGFDFTWTWNKQKMTLKGDGQWVTVLAPLADHFAWHLYQKVRNQYYTENYTKLMKEKGLEAANTFVVDAAVEDKIWSLITGERLHTELTEEEIQNDQADLAVLDQELSKMDAAAASNPTAINISSLLENATTEAINAGKDLPMGASASVDGMQDLSNVEGRSATDFSTLPPVDLATASEAQAQAAQQPVAPVLPSETPATPAMDAAQAAPVVPAQPAANEFGDLSELDNQPA